MNYETYRKITKARALVRDVLDLSNIVEGSVLQVQLNVAWEILTAAIDTACREHPEIEATITRRVCEAMAQASTELGEE